MNPQVADVVEAAAYVRESWTQALWLGAASKPLARDMELSLAEIDQVLSRPIVYRSNIVLLRSADGKSNRPSQSWADALRGMEDGLSLQVRNLELFLSSENAIVRLASAIERGTRAKLDSITLFVSPENAQAIKAHADPTEIVTLQIRGEKKWRFEGGERTIILQPGDLMYVPAGLQHEVVAGNALSVSAALVFETPTVRNLLDLVANQEPLKSILTRRLPTPWEEAESARFGALVLQEFANELMSVSEHRLLPLVPQARPKGDKTTVLGLESRGEVGLDSELARTDAAARLDDQDDRLQLHINGVVLETPVFLEQELLAAMSASSRIRPRDLSAKLAEDERLILARKLVRVGLLRLTETEPF
ncbi:JmjC domain-containing protein [Paracoccus benzoatiresistens]|uniref:JmjC domain-containing protein n=1 Tax=Paracoccus benzoatiresistens TaxID=2997341 RepID=A0ABT4JAY5_9RHOB|nr:cupin domain-containing protein [Paracoccus sp. EF6]MCZ0963503.1 hypothetical protein [Paracoccus sp. EF6]